MTGSKLALAMLLSTYGVGDAKAVRGMTPCDMRQWHIDIENMDKPGCSNSWKVPGAWRSSTMNEARMFYETSDACCTDLFEDGDCHLTDFCECKEQEDHTCVITSMQPTVEIDPLKEHCLKNPKWHFDMDTKHGCTNSPRYPDAWNIPKVAIDMLFDTAEGCCEKFTSHCPHSDVCKPWKKDARYNVEHGHDEVKVLNEIKVDIDEVAGAASNSSDSKSMYFE